MSLALLACTLFQRVMPYDPSDTHWLGRDGSSCPVWA